MPSTGKLLANMQRSTPKASMACSSQGARSAARIDPSGIARPDSLQTTLSPRPASASMPVRQSARSSSELERGHPVCSTTTIRSSKLASWAAAA